MSLAISASFQQKITGPRASHIWGLRNRLRWAYLWGCVANSLARLFSRITGVPTLTGELRAIHISQDGTVTDYGVLGRRVVTTAFAEFLVAQLQAETAEWGDFKFHDSGVGTTAENVTDTDIETTDGEARATGSQEEGATANIYRSIGTIAYTSTLAITEHVIASQATAGTALDRTVFAAINVVDGDSIQFSYDLTVNSGG